MINNNLRCLVNRIGKFNGAIIGIYIILSIFANSNNEFIIYGYNITGYFFVTLFIIIFIGNIWIVLKWILDRISEKHD
jgi:hypothetical protein